MRVYFTTAEVNKIEDVIVESLNPYRVLDFKLWHNRKGDFLQVMIGFKNEKPSTVELRMALDIDTISDIFAPYLLDGYSVDYIGDMKNVSDSGEPSWTLHHYSIDFFFE